MKPLDLRARLVAAVGVVAVLQLVVAGLVVSFTRHQMIEQVDARLVVAASQTERHDDRHYPDEEPIPARYGSSYTGQLDSGGDLVTWSESNHHGRAYPPPAVDANDARRAVSRPITVGSDGDDLGYRMVASQDDDTYLITALPLDEVNETVRQLSVVMALAAAAITAVLGSVSWWVLRLGVDPIKRMTASAEAIAAGDLSERITDADPSTEAGRLGHALNTMLGTIETSFAERARAEARLRQFIADASHELRTPVATIRGYAELYRIGGLDDTADLDDAMNRTEQESERMSRLIADMLNLAKLDREPTLATTDVDLAQVVQDSTADAAVAYPDRSITCSTDQGLIVGGDPDLLRQVVANLVGNAIVHTDASVAVSVVAEAHDDSAVLTVGDSGPGMTPEVVERATERFFRADPSRSRHRGGSGLGLAIVASAVDAHGGQLSITSEPGQGTTVTVTLPLLATAAPDQITGPDPVG